MKLKNDLFIGQGNNLNNISREGFIKARLGRERLTKRERDTERQTERERKRECRVRDREEERQRNIEYI